MVLGLTVFVHPTAPLYALTAFAAAVVVRAALAARRWSARRGRVRSRCSSRSCPYYLRTLHVLGDRYGVGTAKAGGRTFTGRPVWDDAIHFLAPGARSSTTSRCSRSVGIVALVVRKDGRVVAFCAITIAAPILFFSFVPANGDSALFFDRYMIPATPAFLVLVVAGCLRDRQLGGRRAAARGRDARRRARSGSSCATSTTGASERGDRPRRGHARGRRPAATAVLFGSTGTSGAFFSSVRLRPSGEPARPLPRRSASRSVDLVDDDSCARALPYVTGRGATARRPLGLLRRLARRRSTRRARPCACPASRVQEVRGHYFVVRSRDAARSRARRSGSGSRCASRGAEPCR